MIAGLFIFHAYYINSTKVFTKNTSNNNFGQILAKPFIVSWELSSDLIIALCRLFFIFGVMYLVFSQICRALIYQVLQVSVMSEKIYDNIMA